MDNFDRLLKSLKGDLQLSFSETHVHFLVKKSHLKSENGPLKIPIFLNSKTISFNFYN